MIVILLSSNPRQLIFPTLQKNDSPFALLPQWLQVLGRKIDVAADLQDQLKGVGRCSVLSRN